MTGKTRIVEGHIAPSPIPWIVSIWSPDVPQLETFCTGTILDKRTVLTARHCISENPQKNGTLLRMMVMAGSTKVQAGTNMLVDRVIFAEESLIEIDQRPSEQRADMAILKLKSSLSFTKDIKPLCLPTKPIGFEYGLECFIGGWGIHGKCQ